MTFTTVLCIGLTMAQEWQHFTLQNDVRVSVLEVADAPRQSAFTFLPIGLADDGPGRAQFAHLIEHMLICSTDPDARFVDGVLLNGETGELGMRLEALAEPEYFRAALSRQVRWWYARQFAGEVLEREKSRIEQEVISTSSNGATHKWSVAAWAQAMSGLRHSAVSGDVQAATIERLQNEVRARVQPGPSWSLVCVGPCAVTEVRQCLEEELALVAQQGAEAAVGETVTANDPIPFAVAEESGAECVLTWDLSTSHRLEWYEVPCASAEDRVAAEVLAQAANLALQRAVGLNKHSVMGVAFSVRCAGKRYVLLTACSKTGALPAEWAKDWRTVHDGLKNFLGIEFLAGQVARIDSIPDFAQQRKLYAGRPGAEFLEAQAAMNAGYTQLRTGVAFAEAARIGRSLTPEDLRARAERAFRAENRRSAWLLPKDS